MAADVAVHRRTDSSRRPGRRLVAWSGWSTPALRAGVLLLGVLVVAAVVVSAFAPDPSRQDLVSARMAPSGAHPFGTDPLGRDVLAWTASGILLSLRVALSVVLVAGTIGVIVGLLAGYFGGVVDGVLMRLSDLQLAVPPLLLFISASAVLSRSTTNLVLLISVVAWVPYARTVRARVAGERRRGHVAAARLAGTSHARILARHVAPAAITITLVIASLQVGAVLIWEAGLSFVGLGVNAPDTSLGFMIAQGRDALTETWWLVAFPGAALVLLILSANLIGDGLRDALEIDSTETQA